MHLQSGAFGMAYLERDLATGENVAIKYIPRGPATVRRDRQLRARGSRGGSQTLGEGGMRHALTRADARWAFAPRQINRNVQRETVTHRLLRHPNIIAFKKARSAPASAPRPKPNRVAGPRCHPDAPRAAARRC